jgi:hypothetical protein
MNTNAFVMQQLARHESSASMDVSRLQGARTLEDVMRAVNFRTRAPAHLRCLAQVKQADASFNRAAERMVDSLLSHRLASMEGLIGHETFCQSLEKIQRDLRMLQPHFPRQVQAAVKSIREFETSADRSSERPRMRA